MRNGSGGGGFFFGFLVGAAIGGAAAVLLTQEETRDMIVGKAREASNMAMDATQDLRGRVNDVAAQVQANAADLYHRGRQVVEDARDTVDAAVQEGKTAAGQAREDIQWRREV